MQLNVPLNHGNVDNDNDIDAADSVVYVTHFEEISKSFTWAEIANREDLCLHRSRQRFPSSQFLVFVFFCQIILSMIMTTFFFCCFPSFEI